MIKLLRIKTSLPGAWSHNFFQMRDLLDLKIKAKRAVCKQRGSVKFNLSKLQVQALLNDAGITVEDWSISGYHLARYGDQGDYEWGNCRFITVQQNMQERKISEKARINAQQSRMRMTESNRGKHRTQETKNKISIANTGKRRDGPGYWTGKRRARETIRKIRNSISGRVWIHNQLQTKMVKAVELPRYLASGWARGRKLC